MDPRVWELARIAVEKGGRVKKNDFVQIFAGPEARELVLALYSLCLKKGAFPSIRLSLEGQQFAYYSNAKKFQLKRFPKLEFDAAKKTDAYFSIQSGTNRKELSRVPTWKMALRQKATRPIQNHLIDKSNWCILPFPSNAFAQDAEMSLAEYEDFVYSATNFDFSKLKPKFETLRKLENKTDKVRIVGKGTDLTFSIKGRKAINDIDWMSNIPAGEVFNSVVEDSAEGDIFFDFPAVYQGNEVDGVRLRFRKGKVVEASAEKNNAFLQKVLDMDTGARFLGEFGFGLNYGIKQFTKNILFDEKIGGTIHLALGRSYKECKGKNDSIVHWDMIKDLRKDGRIEFDGRIVEKKGKLKI